MMTRTFGLGAGEFATPPIYRLLLSTEAALADTLGRMFSGGALGEQLARGSRSVVYAWGNDAVAKVPLPSTPEGWMRYEATYTSAVYECGAPVPKVLGIEIVDGREAIIFERVDGPSMWDEMMKRQSEATAFGQRLGGLHRDILSMSPPITLPTQRSRLASKIGEAARTIDHSLNRALRLLPPSPGRVMLCHGDFHPKNIILSAHGPVVVDWFDASRGDPCADVARTSLLLSGGPNPDRGAQHLPGASLNFLRELHDSYLGTVDAYFTFSESDLSSWRLIEAAARLAEGVDAAPLLVILRDL
jgi:Phosphotransferase enzyme family